MNTRTSKNTEKLKFTVSGRHILRLS